MSTELLVTAIGAILTGLVYFAGIKRGERQERKRQEEASRLEAERRLHERQLEEERQAHAQRVEEARQANEQRLEDQRRNRAIAARVAGEYADMVRRSYDSGFSALSRLGLATLPSDDVIRGAIEEMYARTGRHPFGQHADLLQTVDLVAFFTYVRENGIRFNNDSVPDIVATVIARGGARQQPNP